ncbi:MAG: hypothetical protein AAGF04_03975 [Chlamydiota bacterium]
MEALYIVIIGEADKGRFVYPYELQDLEGLFLILGPPPEGSGGIDFASRTLLRGGKVCYLRVKKEGFSTNHYQSAFRYLRKQESPQKGDALFLPGVFDPCILEQAQVVAKEQGMLLLLQEKDLFDYLTM